jgi:mono/diheme cytochrome c family protein
MAAQRRTSSIPVFHRAVRIVLGAVGLLASGACNDTNNMTKQPRYEPLEATTFFDNGSSSRTLVAGTVPHGLPGQEPVVSEAALPGVAMMATLRRGQERFDIFCSPCHGRDGYADGMVVRRGYPAPPSFHTARLREAPDAQLERAIEFGLGKMPPYGPYVGPEDRRAAVTYIRALQFSQDASIADVPPDVQTELMAQK